MEKKEGTVTISLKEHDRLREVEEKFNSKLCTVYYNYSYEDGCFSHEVAKAHNLDAGMDFLSNKLLDAEDKISRLSKKKWYQFIEKK